MHSEIRIRIDRTHMNDGEVLAAAQAATDAVAASAGWDVILKADFSLGHPKSPTIVKLEPAPEAEPEPEPEDPPPAATVKRSRIGSRSKK